jgi:hypothetical protein
MGIEALQLALLGVAVLLVCARVRVLALRRRRAPGATVAGSAPAAVAPRRPPPEHDEWVFPDPEEPAPIGLLPSTAVARRQARLRT